MLKLLLSAVLLAPALVGAADLYRDNWSAREMLDVPVRGEQGEEIGQVKDIIVDRNGDISRIVVEVGGFLELGDQHIGVPWRDVKIGEDMEFVQVPLREVESGTYSLYGEVRHGEDVPIPLTSWRVNELIGDYAALSHVPRYGLVTDVIFNNRGHAQSVVVDRAGYWGGYGLYAFPFTGYHAAAYAHPLPDRSETVVALQPFDYSRLGKESRYAGEDGGASAGSSAR